MIGEFFAWESPPRAFHRPNEDGVGNHTGPLNALAMKIMCGLHVGGGRGRREVGRIVIPNSYCVRLQPTGVNVVVVRSEHVAQGRKWERHVVWVGLWWLTGVMV